MVGGLWCFEDLEKKDRWLSQSAEGNITGFLNLAGLLKGQISIALGTTSTWQPGKHESEKLRSSKKKYDLYRTERETYSINKYLQLNS